MPNTRHTYVMWSSHWDDAPYHSTDDAHNRTTAADKPIIRRRNGETIWTPHKCIRCGAGREHAIAWIRTYESDWTQNGNQRLHEQCTRCGRTTSWPYEGLMTPGRGLQTRAPHHVKDTQRTKVYTWEGRQIAPREWASFSPEALVGQTFTAQVRPPADGNAATLQDMVASGAAHRVDRMNLQWDWDKCVAFVGSVFAHYNVAAPEVVKGRGCKSWMRAASRMSLNPSGRNRWVILHETAHAMTQLINDHVTRIYTTEGAHGPTFMAVYCLLLEQLPTHPTTSSRTWPARDSS